MFDKSRGLGCCGCVIGFVFNECLSIEALLSRLLEVATCHHQVLGQLQTSSSGSYRCV